MTGRTSTPPATAAVPRQAPPSRGSASPANTLNARDLEVLRCLADGDSTRRIAAALSISSNTVRTRIRRIQGRLDTVDRAESVAAARDLGLLRIPRPRPPTE